MTTSSRYYIRRNVIFIVMIYDLNKILVWNRSNLRKTKRFAIKQFSDVRKNCEELFFKLTHSTTPTDRQPNQWPKFYPTIVFPFYNIKFSSISFQKIDPSLKVKFGPFWSAILWVNESYPLHCLSFLDPFIRKDDIYIWKSFRLSRRSIFCCLFMF